MASRRMRIKAVINVPRIKTEPQDQPLPAAPAQTPPSEILPGRGGSGLPSSPAPVLSPRICSAPVSPAIGGPVSPVIDHPPPVQTPPPEIPCSPGLPTQSNFNFSSRAATPPVDKIPSSPKSPASWQLQRPSPSKSPAGLPPSGTILRRSPSPALMNTARLTNSPGPHAPLSPVKSPIPNYSTQQKSLEIVKFSSRTPVVVMPISSGSLGATRSIDFNQSPYPTSASPGLETNLKSPPDCFRPPPSPSSHQDFYSVKSPSGVIARPSPAQSPVYGISGLRTSSSFLSHHFNSNSNSADSHEVAALMSSSSNVPLSPAGSLYPPTPDKSHRHSGRDSAASRGSENSYPGGAGAFSSISNKSGNYPSFSQSILENPEAMKKRAEVIKKEVPNPTKFSQARREFFEKFLPGQVPEKTKMTMLHYTFYNPPRPDGTSGNSKSGAARRSRSRASSICSDVDSKHDIIVNEKGKPSSAPSSIGSRRTTASSMGSGGSAVSAHDDNQSDAGSTASNTSAGVPGPRVKVGPDGQLIIDETSLVVETSESQRARQQIEDMEVVSGANYAVGSSGFYRYKRSYRRGHDWTEKETIRFYRALNQCGTDFSMMLSLFPTRSRQELKSKFKREDRKNPDMVSKALASCHFDPDEGISSDEELALYYSKGKVEGGELTEKEKRLQEEVEVEQVICSEGGSNPKARRKKEKKKQEEFTEEQKKELELGKARMSGIGLGKGKKWNTPVDGLEGGKLPVKKDVLDMPSIKVELQGSTPATYPDVAKPVKTPKAKKPKSKKDAAVEVTEGVATVPIILAAGVLQPTTTISAIKTEKLDGPETSPEKSQIQSDKSSQEETKGKRRRITKTKPNVQRGDVAKRRKTSNDADCNDDDGVGGNSSQNSASEPATSACDVLFRFDASDPLGQNVVPIPLPVAEETLLEGNEEGVEELTFVDLDELNSIKAAYERERRSSGNQSTPSCSPRRRRQSSSANTDGIPVTTRITGDPYGKSIMTTMAITKKEKDGGTSALAGGSVGSTSKKVKVLPYRVPGPGGTLPTCPPQLADELEIEIELNTPSTES